MGCTAGKTLKKCDNCALKMIDLRGNKEGIYLVNCDLLRFTLKFIFNQMFRNHLLQIFCALEKDNFETWKLVFI